MFYFKLFQQTKCPSNTAAHRDRFLAQIRLEDKSLRAHRVLPQADQAKLTALSYVFIDLQLYLASSGEGGVGRAICENNAP